MKVLALSNLFPRAARRVLGAQPGDTLLALSRHCEVRVVVPVPAWRVLARPLELLLPRRELWADLDAIFPLFYSIPGVHCLHASGIALSLRTSLQELHEELPWDVIVAARAYPDAAAAAHFARWWDTPLVTIALGGDLEVLPAYFGLRPQIQWALSRSARVVAASPALARKAIDLGAPRQRVVVQRGAVFGTRDTVGERYFRLLEEVLAEWRSRRATVVDTGG